MKPRNCTKALISYQSSYDWIGAATAQSPLPTDPTDPTTLEYSRLNSLHNSKLSSGFTVKNGKDWMTHGLLMIPGVTGSNSDQSSPGLYGMTFIDSTLDLASLEM
ncbi:hypothetical protein UY3_11111 [Chelonia mydas]|uniref:Uncharacterized protein n=1 Tax=Chelonia mydas TaxID=8469 RepID=M7B1M7_CHEMY|nr:hypothetical protein UY3_11111 [Chelonia mydas]